MDIRDLLRRNAACDQLVPNVMIHAEPAVFRRCRCGQIGENKLRRSLFGSLLPDVEYILHDQIQLAARLVRQGRVDNTLVERQLSSVVGDE